MQLFRLLQEITGSAEGASKRSQYDKLAQMLNANRRHSSDKMVNAKVVGKWFDRESIPSAWLTKMVVASGVAGRPINLVDYA